MRDTPFETMEEIAAYVGGEAITCLECGKPFQMITGKHLQLIHGMSQDEYRDRWGIPRSVGLATKAVKDSRRKILKRLVESGALNYDHLPSASDPATRAPMTPKVRASQQAHSLLVRKLRPGDHARREPGAKRRNGRSIDRAREYQQAYRSMRTGDPVPMQAYREKYRNQTDD